MKRQPAEDYIHFLLVQVGGRVGREFTPAFSALDISVANWRILLALGLRGTCGMTELAEYTMIDRTTLTRTIDHMEADGLVERLSHQGDRRAVAVGLTSKGAKVLESAKRSYSETAKHNLSILSKAELESLTNMLERVLTHVVKEETLYEKLTSLTV